MKEYTILKNWHYAFFLFERLFGWYYGRQLFLIKFKFSNECWWGAPRNIDDQDLNKLIGLSFGYIHKNSVRLAWKPNFDKPNIISVFAYIYDSSSNKFISKYMCDVETNKDYMCYLNLHDSEEYVFNVLGIGTYEIDNITKDKKIQKLLYPYFGGNNAAPQKMKIWAELKYA